MSIYPWLRARWAPEKTALISSQGATTFAELELAVQRAAGWLTAAGLVHGDVLALQMPRSVAFLELHLAALALGVVTLPINDRYTPAESDALLEDSGAKLAVLPDDRRSVCPVVAFETVRPALDDAARHPLPTAPAESDVAVLCYTSGTTGRPKGALITHGNLQACVQALRDAWRWSADDVLIHALPLYHVHGLFVAQHGALAAGATTVWLDDFSPEAVWRAIEQHRGTVFMGVPTFYRRLLAAPGAPDLSTMRLFTSGSAPLPSADHEAFTERFGFAVLERYGMTEIGIVLSNPYDGERRPGAVGFPLPGTAVAITDPTTGVPLADGEVGEVRIKGPSVFPGYLNRPEATAEAVEDGWMHTGDLGYLDPDGYVTLVGRAKDLIITGGLNVYPGEIEAALRDFRGVVEAAVVGLPDADLGEVVAAQIVTDAPVVIADLRAALRQRLSGYKVPRHLQIVDALPRNAMGKVQKSVIRNQWAGLH